MNITVQTPSGWQAPALPLASLSYQNITPATGSADAMALGVKTGQQIGAPLAATAQQLTQDYINAPITQATRAVALKTLQGQSSVLDQQAAMRQANAAYYGLPGATPQPLANSGPAATGATVSQTPAIVSDSTRPQVLGVKPPAPAPTAVVPPPSASASPAATPAPVSAPTGTAAAPAAAPSQAQPGEVQWIGVPGAIGSIIRGGRIRPGYEGTVTGITPMGPTIEQKPIPVTHKTVTDAATGQETEVAIDPSGAIISSTSLPKSTSKSEVDALADFNKGNTTSVATSREGLAKLDQLEQHLDAAHTGPTMGSWTPPMLNQDASNINGMTDSLVGLAKTIPGSKFTNMDFSALRGQIPAITDYQTSYHAKANELRDAFISNIERQNYVQNRVGQGAKVNQAQQEYTNFQQKFPVLQGNTLTRRTPLDPNVIANYHGTVNSQQEFDALPSGASYTDSQGNTAVKP